MWLRLIRHSHWTKQSRFNQLWITVIDYWNYPNQNASHLLTTNKSIAIVWIHTHCTWLKVHIDSCHESESITMMRHAFVHQWMNKWTNEWIDQRALFRLDLWFVWSGRDHNLYWCHSSNEVKNVSFRWTLMVSSHLDDHYHSLFPTTDSLSVFAFTAFTIGMLTWWLKSLGWSLNQMIMTIVFLKSWIPGGRLTAQWVGEWELLFVHDATCNQGNGMVGCIVTGVVQVNT